MLTFTNKATAEMKRENQQTTWGMTSLGFVGTITLLCQGPPSILEPAGLDKNFIIYDDGGPKNFN